jgi:hypothetical protein
MPLWPPQIPQWLTWARTWDSTERGRQLSHCTAYWIEGYLKVGHVRCIPHSSQLIIHNHPPIRRYSLHVWALTWEILWYFSLQTGTLCSFESHFIANEHFLKFRNMFHCKWALRKFLKHISFQEGHLVRFWKILIASGTSGNSETRLFACLLS